MRALAWLLGALGLVAIAVAVTPAALLDVPLSANTRGALRLTDTHGTIWRGGGALTATNGAWRVPLGWSVHAWELSHAVLQVDLHPPREGDVPQGTVTIAMPSVQLKAVRAALPAAALQALLPTQNPLALAGNVLFETPSLRWDGSSGAGAADLHWERARAGFNGLTLDLGTVSMHAAFDGPQLTGAFSNVGGDVAVSGTGAWSTHAAMIDADLRARPGAPSWIPVAMTTFGRPDADGVVHITWHATP